MLKYKTIINKITSEKHDIDLNKKQTTKLSSIELDQDDWKMLELIKFVLKSFVHATELFKTYSYFDPIGYGCLIRRKRRACEVYIIELEEQHAIEEVNDEADVNQMQ
ncbi:unnamed protein product [Rotaria sp. Silwood2]|nr:unnamed protein product [Rotaria sp. Silwood2]